MKYCSFTIIMELKKMFLRKKINLKYFSENTERIVSILERCRLYSINYSTWRYLQFKCSF